MNGFESAFSLSAKALDLLSTPAGYGMGVWILTIIFAWSGLTKLRRPTLTAMAMQDFGVLRRVRPRLGSLLGAAELLLALSLMLDVLPAVFLPVTAGLLWFFVLLIARSLWSGKDFSCFCFGGTDSRISRSTLVRNVALALLASALAVNPPSFAGFDRNYLLQAISAVALVGAITLASQVAKLLRWNRDPHRLGTTEIDR